MKEKIVEVKISELKDSFYLRTKLDEDHLQYLWSLREAGVDLGPIYINTNLEIIDGRHRTYVEKELMNKETIKAIIIEGGNLLSHVKKGLEFNTGGSLPPTKRDIEHAISHLLQSGFPRDKILNELGQSLPRTMLRPIYQKAIWKINNRNVMRAISAMAENPKLSPERAAALFEVPVTSIQEKLQKRKTIDQWVTENKKILSSKYTHFNKSNGHLVTEIFNKFDEGEIQLLQAKSILEHLGKLIGNQNKIWLNWEKRWISRSNSSKSREIPNGTN